MSEGTFLAPKERYCYLCLRPLPDLTWYQRIAWGVFAPADNRCPPREDWECFEHFTNRPGWSTPDPEFRRNLREKIMEEFDRNQRSE